MKFFALYTGAAFFFTYCNLFASDSLIQAAQDNNTFLVYQLLSNNADPNATDQATGNTALHYAVEKNNIPMATLLLMRNADRDRVNKSDQKARDLTPRKNSDFKQIRRLLKKNRLSHYADPHREALVIYHDVLSKITSDFIKQFLTFPLTAAQITVVDNTVETHYTPLLQHLCDKKDALRINWFDYVIPKLNEYCSRFHQSMPTRADLEKKEQECLRDFRETHVQTIQEILRCENAPNSGGEPEPTTEDR